LVDKVTFLTSTLAKGGRKMFKMKNWQKFGFFVVLLTCFITVWSVQTAVAAGKGPIKIGYLAPLTGARAQVGGDMLTGWKMGLEEAGYKAAGRKIELIVEDHGTPTVAVTKVRKLINHDKVHLIGGIFASHVSYAVAPLCKEANIPLIITGTNGNDVTQRKHSKNIIRANCAGSQICHVAGDYAYNKLGWRNVAILGWEHAFGQESIGAFQRVFEENGGKVIQRIYVPRKTLDFGPYVSSLKSGADGLFAVITAGPSMRFLKTLKASGIMDKWKVLMVMTGTDESFLQEVGKAAMGVLSANNWSPALDTPESKAFMEKAKKMTDREISNPLMDSYVGAVWALKGIEAANGDVEDKDKFIDALWAVEIKTSPRGPLKLDTFGNPIQNVFIRRVEKVNGRYQNSVIDVYKNVSQFWKYDPVAFVKEPPYSKNNPPCKYCK